jgi:uncharacterized protein YkwD
MFDDIQDLVGSLSDVPENAAASTKEANEVDRTESTYVEKLASAVEYATANLDSVVGGDAADTASEETAESTGDTTDVALRVLERLKGSEKTASAIDQSNDDSRSKLLQKLAASAAASSAAKNDESDTAENDDSDGEKLAGQSLSDVLNDALGVDSVPADGGQAETESSGVDNGSAGAKALSFLTASKDDTQEGS